jgi:hypothetical protein
LREERGGLLECVSANSVAELHLSRYICKLSVEL